ncbi:hypothetical protein HMPREF1322_0841 [Porphyromonas gingivalis W50]|nr:hypothetical protein HMPREF1322_0841 [Porphyromonas gingivalis W50]
MLYSIPLSLNQNLLFVVFLFAHNLVSYKRRIEPPADVGPKLNNAAIFVDLLQ